MYDPRQQPPVTPPQFGQYGQEPQQYQQPQYEQQQPPQFQPRHQAPAPRHGNQYIGWTAGILAVAFAGAAFYVLHNRAPSAPLTCPQQYQAWKTGPASAGGKKMKTDAAALSSASGDIKVMNTSLQAMGADATALQAYPMPKCADPAGYWTQYLSAIRAAGDNAGTASGLGGLLLAEAPLKQVPAIQSKLTAELAKTAGVNAAS